MANRPSLFTTNASTSSLFTSVTSYSDSVDLREEFDCLIFGTDGRPRQGHPLVLRRMRRDSTGRRIDCTCKQQFSGEGSPTCPYCQGEGYLWDEEWMMGRGQFIGTDGGLGNRYRKPPPGEIRADTKMFFLRYDIDIKHGDKIIEAKLDEEGNAVVPLIRKIIYKPQTIDALRGDNGRIEFFTIYCLERDAIRQDELQ